MTPDPAEKLALEAAIAEVKRQALGTTRQYLGSHRLLLEDGKPVPLAVLPIDQGFAVYFGVKDEPYFIALSMYEYDGRWEPSLCYAEASCNVYLAIKSETVPPEEISALVGLQPTESWRMGDPRKLTNPPMAYKFHGWFFDPSGRGPGDFETKLKRLLDLTEASAPSIRALTDTCRVSVVVPYRGYKDQMWGLAIEPGDLSRLAALGAVLDVDLYAYGPDLFEG